eukprot:evm.model.NODE_33010_length_23105_cov_32.110020.2
MSVLVLGATGNVGRHIVRALLNDPDRPQVVAATRDIGSEGAKALLASASPAPSELSLAELDMTVSDAAVLATALTGYSVIVLTLPQVLSPADMIECQKAIAEAVADCMKHAEEYGGVIPLVVKLSSYGIDGQHSQGPLGEAHRIGEAVFQNKGIPLVSLRPTSFFSNFEAFDWPTLRDGGRKISSPLGQEARVNWVACEDIGRVAAVIINEHLRTSQGGRSKPQCMFRAVDVVGPASNTLSAPDLCRLVGLCLGARSDGSGGRETEAETRVMYQEVALPAQEDYRGLWMFLRQGGFDVQESKSAAECLRLLGGRPLTEFRTFVAGLVRDMRDRQIKTK